MWHIIGQMRRKVFPAYLRGIETYVEDLYGLTKIGFPAYLRGIETNMRVQVQKLGGRFPAYLRGIETGLCRNLHHG